MLAKKENFVNISVRKIISKKNCQKIIKFYDFFAGILDLPTNIYIKINDRAGIAIHWVGISDERRGQSIKILLRLSLREFEERD